MKPILGITMGDPAGVGPEVVGKALSDFDRSRNFIPVVIGDPTVLQDTLDSLGLDTKIVSFQNFDQFQYEEQAINVFDFDRLDRTDFQIGKVHAGAGDLAYKTVVKAVDLCRDKKIDAMVTAPICKESLHLAGHYFDGHTGLIAHLTNTTKYRMMFASEKLKALHVTAHMSLVDACAKITSELVFDTIQLGNDHLIQMGFNTPRIAVCGLNPHAGENGIFGREDIDIITPAVEQAKSQGMVVEGPLPADTTFMKAYRGSYDLVIAQYHDQGHVPGKLIAFDTGVNVTVGLPVIRTSVDHGTAFDIAGQGIANYKNLYCAIDYALSLVTPHK